VFVAGSGWTPAFKNFLSGQGLGDATFGYAVPAGAAQLAVLPWGNLNQISVRFSRDVLALDVDLAVRGANVASYAVADFDYDTVTHTATWTLAQSLRNDKLLLDLDGGADGIVDASAIALDGEWANGTDSFPSGDGTAGGDLRFRLNVLPGDVSRDGKVNAFDWYQLRARRLGSVTRPGTGLTGYTPFYDPDGSGTIGTTDLLYVRRNLLASLPTTDPAGAGSGTLSATRDVLGA
jgi:hypothetical protein